MMKSRNEGNDKIMRANMKWIMKGKLAYGLRLES